MKASKAAQNCSRIASRSIRISCRAPGITMACPALSRAAKRSVAGVAQTGSAPAATIRVGRRILSGVARIGEALHEPEGRIEPARPSGAPMAPAPDRGGGMRRCGRSGPDRSVSRLPAKGLRGDRGLAAAGHEGLAEAEELQSAATSAAARRADLDHAERDHRASW